MITKLELPTLKRLRVYHLGTLDAEHRGHQWRTSLEGHCLSVSTEPDAWRKIAKLGGSTCHTLSNDHGTFVDVYRALRSKPVKTALITWALEQELCVEIALWPAWHTDEDGSSYYTLHDTQEEALLERTDEDHAIRKQKGYKATPKLEYAVQHSNLDMLLTLEMALLVWVEQCYPEHQGLWWNDPVNVYGYTAPRGGIFPHKLTEWAITSDAPLTAAQSDCILR